MDQKDLRYVYGPVPSRRLGHSLGVDLVTFKTCTYDCIYCQLGRTTNKTVERREYVPVAEILKELELKLAEPDRPDYISLAGSGEPTLNSGLGRLIRGIKQLTDIPVAVLTNGSLLWQDEVQDALMAADLVLPSLDVGDEFLFDYVNRPHEDISFMQMIGGIVTFAQRFQGELWLEILLLAGVTGLPAEVKKIAELAARINPTRIQLNTVWRPGAEEFALVLSPKQLQSLAREFSGPVEIVCEDSPAQAENSPRDKVTDTDIMALLRRRPCTLEDISRGLGMHVAEIIKRMDGLLAAGKAETLISGGKGFYVAAGMKIVGGDVDR